MRPTREQVGAAAARGRLFNRTRTSPSIPRRLLREGKVHLLPLYALLRTSDLAREGIENSGSYRFADHVYRGRAGGRLGVGKLLDGALLRMRGARSMRNRFFHARAEILAAAFRHPAGWPFRVLSVPCGIARELIEAAEILRAADPSLYARASFFGIDLDPRPLELSRALAAGKPGFRFLRADALDAAAYPPELDLILSAGLGEFLGDEQLVRFYAVCRAALREGGSLVTSATRRDSVSDYLMRELAELSAHYREPGEIVRLLRRAGFHDISARLDDVGLQTLLVARRSAVATTNESGGTR
ncbi:MAG TPA: class I SAM-dependent methyltransferase family protein [Gemmatimonadota bacterium]|nr:class I SAM-dependent methyltransferase family protein [Gemmatimonadota bacterium]